MKTYRVKVAAGQRKETLSVSGERIQVSVKEKPSGGTANRRVIELIAMHFGVPVKRVRIMQGHQAPRKRT
jgi:uncharacterized protein YggU (UPF0235/DUF167 family)